MSNLHSIQRLLAAAGAGVALCAAALPASAQEAAPETAQAVQSADAQTVARDATTGQLRAATAEEQAKLQARRTARSMHAARAGANPMQQKYHVSGARGLRLTDEFLSSSKAVRTPDGKIEMICNEAHGDAPAAPHVHAAATTPVTE